MAASFVSHVPYQDIIRHEIITTAGVDREGRTVVVFYACRLPPKEHIDHERLLEYLVKTMSDVVENDYTMVYFHHGLRSSNKPGVKWAIRAYRELDRSFKKNVKKMFIVHPTSFIRGLLTAFKPVTSAKFGKKLSMVSRLTDLESVLYLDQLDVPSEIRSHDSSLDKPQSSSPMFGSRGSFHFYGSSPSAAATADEQVVFGVPLSTLAERCGGSTVPDVLRVCAQYVRTHGLDTVGIFRRSAKSVELTDLKTAFNQGRPDNIAEHDVHTAACLIKMFFRDLPEPLLTYDLYEPVVLSPVNFSNDKLLPATVELLKKLPAYNLLLLFFVLELLTDVSKHESKNMMTIANNATVFAPNLLWSNKVPAGLESMYKINSFVEAMLVHHELLKELMPAAVGTE